MAPLARPRALLEERTIRVSPTPDEESAMLRVDPKTALGDIVHGQEWPRGKANICEPA